MHHRFCDPRGKGRGKPIWGAVGNHHAPFCWTFILGSVPMNGPLGDFWILGSFQLKISLGILTPLTFEMGESCTGFGVRASYPDSQTVQCRSSSG